MSLVTDLKKRIITHHRPWAIRCTSPNRPPSTHWTHSDTCPVWPGSRAARRAALWCPTAATRKCGSCSCSGRPLTWPLFRPACPLGPCASGVCARPGLCGPGSCPRRYRRSRSIPSPFASFSWPPGGGFVWGAPLNLGCGLERRKLLFWSLGKWLQWSNQSC